MDGTANRQAEDRAAQAAAWRSLRIALVCLGCLAIVLVVLARFLLLLILYPGSAPQDSAGLGTYLEIGLWWGVGLCGVCIARSGNTDSPRLRTARVAAGDLGLLLMPLWPLQAALAGALYARRARSRHLALRVGAAVLGAGVLVGGSVWGVAAYEAEQPWRPAHPAASAGDYLGDWHGPAGATLTLRPDGSFTAAGFTGTGVSDYWPSALDDATGHWQVTVVDGSPQLLLSQGPVPTGGEGDIHLDPYGGGHPVTLCDDIGFYDACDLALYR